LSRKPRTTLSATGENDRVLESVVITGFHILFPEALDLKRNASGVVDAILAEHIAA
jgi:iron complex outermembrane recepter protein